MTTVVMSRQPYRRMVRILCQFEGPACLWRVVLGAAIWVGILLTPVGAAIVGIYLAADLQPLAVAAGAALPVAATAAAARAWKAAPWRELLARRLWTYEKPAPEREVQLLLQTNDDIALLEPALRRARLHPADSASLGTPPADAPDLRVRLRVYEPERWGTAPNDAARVAHVAEVVRRCGLRARVGGQDVFP